MKIQKVKLSSIKLSENNPRIIKDAKFKKLIESIQKFPKMLEIRPIVVNSDMVVLGGNMRLKACKEAGLKEVWVLKADDLTEQQQREFIVKDNVGFGEWDWDVLANEWDTEKLNEWGMEVWQTTDEVDIDDLFEDVEQKEKKEVNKIVLEYSEKEYNLIIEKLKEKEQRAEDIFKVAIGL